MTNKIFKLALAALLLAPMGAMAQTSRLNFEDYEQAALTEVSLSDGNGFSVAAKSDKGKVDGNSLNFAYAATDEAIESSFTQRWNVGAPLTPTNANRNMTITVPSSGTLNVYARCANKTSTDRALVLKQGDTEIFNKVIQDADAFKIGDKDCYPIASVEVNAGEISVTTTNTINFYGFSFTPLAATSVDVEVTTAGYATFSNNTAGSLSIPEGLTAYGVSAVGESDVVFTPYNVIPAGKGVLLKGAAATYTLEPTDEECTYEDDNLLVAVTEDMTVPTRQNGMVNYIFANKEHGVGFYKSSGTGTISKGKAYLSIVDESADNRLWTFTSFSEATIADLEAERTGAAENWTLGAEKNGAYRYKNVGALTEAELVANGNVIAETAGLLFTAKDGKLGIDCRSTATQVFLDGTTSTITIADLKADHTVTITARTSSSSAAAYMTCTDETKVTREGDTESTASVDNVFTILAGGTYTFAPNRSINVTKITIAPIEGAAAGAEAREFYGFENVTTGIGASLNDKGEMINDQVYDLQGRRVEQQSLKSGIYVRNGKKVLVK